MARTLSEHVPAWIQAVTAVVTVVVTITLGVIQLRGSSRDGGTSSTETPSPRSTQKTTFISVHDNIYTMSVPSQWNQQRSGPHEDEFVGGPGFVASGAVSAMSSDMSVPGIFVVADVDLAARLQLTGKGNNESTDILDRWLDQAYQWSIDCNPTPEETSFNRSSWIGSLHKWSNCEEAGAPFIEGALTDKSGAFVLYIQLSPGVPPEIDDEDIRRILASIEIDSEALISASTPMPEASTRP